MARRITTSQAGAKNIKNRILGLVKKMQADSAGWIHGANAKIRKALQMSTSQVYYYLAVLVQEGTLVQRKRGSSLYRLSDGPSLEVAPSKPSSAGANNIVMTALEKRRESIQAEIQSRHQKLEDIERLMTLLKEVMKKVK